MNNRVLSPLRQVPGPLLASLSGKWLILIDLAGNRTTKIHELHKQYGPAVRIGPKEVSFSDISCIKEVYGQQTAYTKAPIYETFSVKPLGIFSLRDKTMHSERRRLLSHAFSQANLYDTEPLIAEKVDRLNQLVQDHADQPLNIFALFRMLALEVVGKVLSA